MVRMTSSPTRSPSGRSASRVTHSSTGTSVKSCTTTAAPQARASSASSRTTRPRRLVSSQITLTPARSSASTWARCARVTWISAQPVSSGPPCSIRRSSSRLTRTCPPCCLAQVVFPEPGRPRVIVRVGIRPAFHGHPVRAPPLIGNALPAAGRYLLAWHTECAAQVPVHAPRATRRPRREVTAHEARHPPAVRGDHGHLFLRQLLRDPQHGEERRDPRRDRKSTRLNSSHSQISYAVFCLKKQKPKIYRSSSACGSQQGEFTVDRCLP